MFQASLCPSSGEQDRVLLHMVFCTGNAGCGCVELGRKLCALCATYCSNSNLHTVHTALRYVTVRQNISEFIHVWIMWRFWCVCWGLSNYLQEFISVINQLNAQNLVLKYVYYMPLHVSNTVLLIIMRSKLYYTTSGIVTPVGGRPVHRLREDCAPDGHQQSVTIPDASSSSSSSSSSGAEPPLIGGFGLLNDILPLWSILDTG